MLKGQFKKNLQALQEAVQWLVHKRSIKTCKIRIINFFQIDADPDDALLPAEYHELILETGFYIYFLISYYSELDTQEIDFETSSELQDIK